MGNLPYQVATMIGNCRKLVNIGVKFGRTMEILEYSKQLFVCF